MSLPRSVLEFKADDDEDIWMKSLPERYLARPDSEDFHNMCLAEFASEYRILYGDQQKSKHAQMLKNDMGFIQKRSKSQSAIIRYSKFSETHNSEKFYRSQLKVNGPFVQTLCIERDSYMDAI